MHRTPTDGCVRLKVDPLGRVSLQTVRFGPGQSKRTGSCRHAPLAPYWIPAATMATRQISDYDLEACALDHLSKPEATWIEGHLRLCETALRRHTARRSREEAT